ncbi:MAG: hypothetical protein PHU25_15870 [Deltaproteobacteria bacterium]|nr:hypothetical protein [Deltaproteobacteria bacterium]
MTRTNAIVALALALGALHAGCSKRQIIPGALAGVGAATLVGGVSYRATLPENDSEGLLGRTPKEQAVTASLVFTGAALVAAGIIWSVTTPVCETDTDCWTNDRCDKAASTCVPRQDLMPQLRDRPTAPAKPASLVLPPVDHGAHTLTLSVFAM